MSVPAAQFSLASAADPVSVYRAYLNAVTRRDFAAVTQVMSADYAKPLRDLERSRDFAPLFELWCESQTQPVAISSCCFDGECAVIETRAGRERGSITLRVEDGRWRVAGER